MFCFNCGKEIDDNAVICPNCGVEQKKHKDHSRFWLGLLYGILGFCMPSAGIVLYLVWNNDESRQLEAKASMIGMLTSCVINMLILIVSFIVGRYTHIFF